MVGSTCVSKEGDKPSSRKKEIAVAKVKVVISNYKDSSKESRNSAEWLVINWWIKMSWRKADESYKKEEKMSQNQGVLQICRRTKINPDPCTFACRKKCSTWAVAVEMRCGWWENEKWLVQGKFLLHLDAVEVINIWKWPESSGDQSCVLHPTLAVCWMCVRIRKPFQWALSEIGVAWNIPEVIAKCTDFSSFRNCLWC